MTIQINITADNGDDFINQLAQLARALVFAAPDKNVKLPKRVTQPEVVDNAGSSASVQPSVIHPAAEAGPKPSPTVVEPVEEAPQSEGAVKHLEISDIRPRAQARGAESAEINNAVIALIAKYGQGKISAVPPEDRAAFLAEVEAL